MHNKKHGDSDGAGTSQCDDCCRAGVMRLKAERRSWRSAHESAEPSPGGRIKIMTSILPSSPRAREHGMILRPTVGRIAVSPQLVIAPEEILEMASRHAERGTILLAEIAA